MFYLLNQSNNYIVLSQGENIAFVKGVLALSAVYDLALLETEDIPKNSIILKKKASTLKTKENITHFLSLGEDMPEPSADLFVTAYPKGEFTKMRKTVDISYEDSQYYVFSVNNSVLNGASGSPVLDERGQVVGVTSSAINNFLHAIKVSHLRAFITGDIGIKCPDFKLDEAVEFASSKACIKEEMENLKKLAEEGSVYAQYHLAFKYYSGRKIDPDVHQAFQWMQKAAEQAYAPAQFMLAVMYYKGDGVDRDVYQAFQWYERSAEQGYVPAQANLARMYEEGDGVDRDVYQAFQWMQKAAEQGYVPAQANLARMYEEGEGVDPDVHQAFQWVQKAAEQAYAPAQFMLAVMYYKGDGVDRDVYQAFQWCKRSVEQGYALAQHMLAVMYYRGEGTDPDMN